MFLVVLAIQTAVLRHHGQTYQVRLDPAAAYPLQIWQNGHKRAESLHKSFTPWKLQIVDVDGDDVDEIAVGVTKTTPNLPFRHRTLFILRFDGEKIGRKWTGSTMGRPLIDFCFGPKRQGRPQVLFTLEKRLDGWTALSAHEWTGFGFRKVGRQQAWQEANGLRCDGDRLILQANHQQVAVAWKGLL